MSALPSALAALMQDLSVRGLNVHGVLPPTVLTPQVRQAIAVLAPDAPPDCSLWVIGHRGRQLWQHLATLWGPGWPQASPTPDPIDDWVRATLAQGLAGFGVRHWLVYPQLQAAALLPLQALGRVLGWGQPSPFQLSLDAQWGSWKAYRAVVCLEADLPLWGQRALAHPCASCVKRACVTACPADALQPQWRGAACAQQRLRANSSCANTCLARLACPVGQDQAYSEQQLRYHSVQSLQFLRRQGVDPQP